MSSPRPLRALAAVALGLSMSAQMLPVPTLPGVRAAEPEPADHRPSPPVAASLGSEALDALRRVRAERPATLRGVLAGIASELAARGSTVTTRAGLGGLITRSTAAGATLVAVTIRTETPLARALVERLDRLGAQIVNRDEASLEAYLAPAVLELVARLPGIESVEPVLPTSLTAMPGPGAALHGATTWQNAGLMGSGVKVGIIDGGFTGIRSLLDVELPGSVEARCYTGVGTFTSSLAACEAEGIDHGTAVAETVADMAPGASLYVANPFSLQDFQRTVTWMSSNGVRIINASLATAYQGPGDGSDPTGASLYTVIAQASNAGILWVNSAGNAGENGWYGPWSDPDGDAFLNFPDGDEENTLELVAGQSLIVTARWNDAWGRARNDYDIGVYDDTGSLIASSVDAQNGDDDPVETLIFEAPASGLYHVAAVRHAGAAASRFQILVLTNGESPLEHRVLADTIPTPVDSRAAGLLTVGAVDIASPDTIEAYSSRGPTLDNRIKPDLVAGDCGATVTNGMFCGTSQSAPHVAGAAALVFEAFPKWTATQVASYLRSRAVPLGDGSPNNVFGAGRLSLGVPPGAPVATGLAFQVQPGDSVEGAPLASQPAVRIVDAEGATVASGPGATLAVTLGLEGGTGATLACDGGLTAVAVAGIAAFSGCRVDVAGTYTLVATANTVSPATSAQFAVTGVPVRLALEIAPGGEPAGAPLAVQPVVRITDAAGVVLAGGRASTLPVTLSLGANADGATLTCTGGTTVTAIGGVAAFQGCTITAPGTGFTLVATAEGAAPAVSARFDVPDPAGVLALPALAVTTSASAVRWGQGVQLTAQVSLPSGGPSVAGRTVRFQGTADGVTWRSVGPLGTTDAAGRVSVSYRPATNLWYRATLLADAEVALGTSELSRVTVRQLGILRPTNGGTVKVVPPRTQIAFRTTVRPSTAAVPPGSVTLQLHRLVGSRWQLVSTQTATPDAAGVATIYVTFPAPGRWYVRSQANPTPVNANSGWSAIERYDVR